MPGLLWTGLVLTFLGLTTPAQAQMASAAKPVTTKPCHQRMNQRKLMVPSPDLLAKGKPVRPDQDVPKTWQAAAALEADYGTPYLGDLRRRDNAAAPSSFWGPEGMGHQSAWYILLWIWMTGAVMAVLVYVTYRHLTLKQLRQQESSKLPNLPRRGRGLPGSTSFMNQKTLEESWQGD
jgi:hypothetical protein